MKFHELFLLNLWRNIEEVCLEGDSEPVFKLADVAQLYTHLECNNLVLEIDKRIHTTRLKHADFLNTFQYASSNLGRDVMLVFDEDIGIACDRAIEQDRDCDSVILARAAQFVCQDISPQILSPGHSMTTARRNLCHTCCLHYIVCMVLEGPSIKDQSHECAKQEALSV